MRVHRGISSCGAIVCLWVVVSACGDPARTSAGDSEGSASSGGSSTSTGPLPTTGLGTSEGSMSGSETMASGSTATSDPAPGTTTTDPTTGAAGESTVMDTSSGEASSSGSSTGGDTGVVPACPDADRYTLDADFDKGVFNTTDHAAPNSDQLQITANGVFLPTTVMFMPHTHEGLILKLDSQTGKQLARYASTRLADCNGCNPDPSKWFPWHVTVDHAGDVYVVNQAYGSQGTVTKIAGSLDHCVDRDGNGMIDTSRDANGDGIIDRDSAVELRGQSDECLLWSLPIDAPNAMPRGVSPDNEGNIYVTTFNTQKGFRIDVTQTPPKVTASFNLPYPAFSTAIRGNYLYQSSLGQPVARFDLTDFSVKTMTAPDNFGLAVDQDGIAWYAGGTKLHRCDFEVGGDCKLMATGQNFQGVTVDVDGQVWVCGWDTVHKFAGDGTLLGSTNATQAWGVSIGKEGHPRVVGEYAAYKIEKGAVGKAAGAVVKHYTGFLGDVTTSTLTASDFTGYGAALESVGRKGEWTVVHDGVDAGSMWSEILWNQEVAGKVPAGTSITLDVRAADAEDGLVLQPWSAVEGAMIKGGVKGRFIELRARLAIVDEMVAESPVLSDVCFVRAG